jgi:hypothetical protein
MTDWRSSFDIESDHALIRMSFNLDLKKRPPQFRVKLPRLKRDMRKRKWVDPNIWGYKELDKQNNMFSNDLRLLWARNGKMKEQKIRKAGSSFYWSTKLVGSKGNSKKLANAKAQKQGKLEESPGYPQEKPGGS